MERGIAEAGQARLKAGRVANLAQTLVMGCAVKGATHRLGGRRERLGAPKPFPAPFLIYCIVIYCIVLARSAKLPTPPWPPAMRSTWMPIFWTPFTSAVVPGLAGGTCGAGLQMSVTKPSFASGM